jgi:hypothetical protein
MEEVDSGKEWWIDAPGCVEVEEVLEWRGVLPFETQEIALRHPPNCSVKSLPDVL